MTRLTIRVDFDSGAAFGPGKAKLLETIAKTGSIRAGAAELGMSYRRAWLLLQEIEIMLGEAPVATATGGARGGGSVLTDLGKELIAAYRALERHSAKASAAEMRTLEKLAKNATTMRKRLPRAAAEKPRAANKSRGGK